MADEKFPYPTFLWKRWDSEDTATEREVEALPEKRLFELCAVPFAGDSFREPEPEDESEVTYFLPPGERLVLRNVPTLVLLFLALVLAEAELNPNAEGVSTLLPEIPVVPLVYLMVAVTVLMIVLVRSEIVSRELVLKASFVYSLAGVLLIGSVYGTYRTLVLRGSTQSVPHVSYTFPTLLFTLILGLLAYDLLLKGENLYGKLGTKNIVSGYRGTRHQAPRHEDGGEITSGKELYDQIRERELDEKLGAGIGPFRYSQVFASLLLLQYLLIWSFNGPLGTGLWSSLLLNSVINLVVLVGVFNFLLGIVFLRNLLSGKYTNDDGERLTPRYLPFHPDRQGGYADIGRLAMRINFIVILIGAYYVYRAYMSGIRTFPPKSRLIFDPLYADLIGIEQVPALKMVFWMINFLGPVALYVLVVSVWFYYTFWEIHKQMAKQKKDLILENQLSRIASDRLNSQDSPLGEYDDREGWQSLRDAPEWPVNTRRLGGLITANFVPLILSVIPVVPDLVALWGGP